MRCDITIDRYMPTALGWMCFLFFSTFLTTKSGHSFVIAALLLLSLISIFGFQKSKIDDSSKWLFALFVVLGVFWSHTFDSLFSLSSKGDYLLRYWLAAFFVIRLVRYGLNTRYLVYGGVVGAIFSAAISYVQYKEIGRAEGFTNAIRFGDMSIVIAMACLSLSLVKKFFIVERVVFFMAALFAFAATAFSLTRGAWLLLLVFPFLLPFFFNLRKKDFLLVILAALFAVASLLAIPATKNRIDDAKNEVIGYFQARDDYVNSSVGARLEMWRAAVKMGFEHPLSGWGDKDIRTGRENVVKVEGVDEFILNYNHAHNDFLEMWVRRGALGVVFLLVIYIVPFVVFKKSMGDSVGVRIEDYGLWRVLHFIGMLIPLAYFIFGLTDTFFVFVISHNFYIFTILFLLMAIRSLKLPE